VTRQRPPVHVAAEGAFAAHELPQPPQFPLSVCSSTHASLHKDHPIGQAHWPLWQVLAPVQVTHLAPPVPHVEIVWLSQTWPLQQPSGHEVPSQMHAPPEQYCPEVQVVPQLPQFPLSVCSLTHTPLHTDCPNGQTQWPLWQVPPTAQGPHKTPVVPQVEFVWLE